MECSLALLLAMIFIASSIYQVTVVGLSALQLVLVGTTLETSIFLLEIPTGIVADVYSRRLSIIIGVLLIGLGFIVEGSLPYFMALLVAQVLWGGGYTFTSGATQAWITDEIGEAAAQQAFLRVSQLSKGANLVGSVLGIGLGLWARINIPIVLGGVLVMLLGIFLSITMPEAGFRPTPREERNSWQHMAYIFRSGLGVLRVRPDLLNILAIGLFYGLYSEGFDRLWYKHMIDSFGPTLWGMQPVLWVGVLEGIGMLLTMAATELVIRRLPSGQAGRAAKALFWLSLGLVGSLLGLAVARSLAGAAAAYWLIIITRSLIGPLYDGWLNRDIDPGVRATIFSMSSQVNAIGQIAGGPGIGLIGSRVAVRAALAASGLALSPALPLIGRTLRQTPADAPEISA